MKKDEDFLSTIKKNLDDSLNDDDSLNNRLAEMRSEALDKIPNKTKNTFMLPILGVGSTMALALAFLVTVFGNQKIDSTGVEDWNNIELLTESEDMEMLEKNDIEFYVWLETELEAPSS